MSLRTLLKFALFSLLIKPNKEITVYVEAIFVPIVFISFAFVHVLFNSVIHSKEFKDENEKPWVGLA